MPFINVKTNCKADTKQVEAIKSKLGLAIIAVPGKSESWLMVEVEDDRKLYFQGSDAPAAMVQVSLYGDASSNALSIPHQMDTPNKNTYLFLPEFCLIASEYPSSRNL